MNTVTAKTIISPFREESAWFGVNYNMNIYRGCNHGCIYCDSRSDCYRVDDFDTIRAKENALSMIDAELRAKRRKGVVGTGAMSDPYNQFERDEKLTRGALELFGKYRFGVAIATKSPLVARDIDLLEEIKAYSPVLCKITLTTVSEELAAKVEPYAPAPKARLHAVKTLSEAGIPVCVLLMPVLPFLEDNERSLLDIVEAAADSGARYIYCYMGVTLRQGQKQYYFNELDLRFPGVRKLYERFYSSATYEHNSLKQRELYRVFGEACKKRGILTRMKDIIHDYKQGYEDNAQLSFLS